jgi:hypothetical protein
MLKEKIKDAFRKNRDFIVPILTISITPIKNKLKIKFGALLSLIGRA